MTLRSLLRASTLLVLVLSLYTPADAQVRTFRDDDVQRTKEFWTKNAKGQLDKRRDCLETINEAMKILYEDRGLKLGSTVDLTMKALVKTGHAKDAVVFGFYDENGRSTYGVTHPVKLRKSVWDGLLELSGGVPGWHLFGLSPLDGNHSVTLCLDTRTPNEPKVYWADQWGIKGGFKLYPDKASLDGEIERLTHKWWGEKLREKGIKFKSDAKVYPLVPTRPAQMDEEGKVIRAQNLFVRNAPHKAGDTHLLDAEGRKRMVHRGQTFKVIGREGVWRQVVLDDGAEAWVHGYFLEVRQLPRVEAPTNTGIAGALGGASSE